MVTTHCNHALFTHIFFKESKLEANETCHFCQRQHIKIQNIEIKKIMYTFYMLQYPLLITCLKASDYLCDKEEIDMNSNLVTESKVVYFYWLNFYVWPLTEVASFFSCPVYITIFEGKYKVRKML